MNIMKKPNTPCTVEDAVSVATATAFDFKERDGKIMFLAKNSATAVATLEIEAGDGIQATTALEISIPASSSVCFNLESGKYKKLYGQNKGSVVMKGSNITVSGFVLP